MGSSNAARYEDTYSGSCDLPEVAAGAEAPSSMPEARRKVSNDLGKQMSDDQGKQKHCGVLRFFVLFCLFILFFISSLQRKLHKKKNKTQTKSMWRPNPVLS